jgi:hypothetical protein
MRIHARIPIFSHVKLLPLVVRARLSREGGVSYSLNSSARGPTVSVAQRDGFAWRWSMPWDALGTALKR